MMSIHRFIICGLVLCAMSSCWERRSAKADPNNPQPATKIDGDDFRDQVHALEKEVAQLRSQLAGRGRGAYKHGSRAITGKPGDETLLDRLYNAETTLKQTKEELDERIQSIAKLKQSVISNDTLIKSLELKAELYEKNKDKIATLQDDRKVKLKEIQDLRANVVETELRLLKLQSRHFNFAREILEIEPGDMQSFLELQDTVKQMTLELKPASTVHDQEGDQS